MTTAQQWVEFILLLAAALGALALDTKVNTLWRK